MTQLYKARGLLDHGFVGQITYTVCLEKTFHKLDIAFTFDKRRFSAEDITPERIAQVRNLCHEKYGIEKTESEARRVILNDMKTEIHTLAMLNGEFIGCIHRQMETRHMIYDGDTATDGCIPQHSFSGVLKVTLLVFNVIQDDTAYTLVVSAE